jgi:hypothetical protein
MLAAVACGQYCSAIPHRPTGARVGKIHPRKTSFRAAGLALPVLAAIARGQYCFSLPCHPAAYSTSSNSPGLQVLLNHGSRGP